MGIFLGLGDAQLRHTALGEVVAQHVGQGLGLEGAAGGDIGGVFRGHHEIRQFGHDVALETAEVGLHEGAGQLAGPVGAEIHEQYAVVVPHQGWGLALCMDNRGQHEFVVLAALVGLLQAGNRGSRPVLGLALGQHAVGLFHPLPVIVPVHGIVAPADAGNPATAQFSEQLLGLLQGRGGAAGRRVAAVQEGVQIDFFRSPARRQPQCCENLPLVTVHSPWRKQAKNMHGAAGRGGFVYGRAIRRVVVKAAVLDSLVDAGDVLVDHPARPQAHMAHLGVAHLACGQPDVQPGTRDNRMGILAPQPVPYRRVGLGYGIVPGLLAVTPAIQDNQDRGFLVAVRHLYSRRNGRCSTARRLLAQ